VGLAAPFIFLKPASCSTRPGDFSQTPNPRKKTATHKKQPENKTTIKLNVEEKQKNHVRLKVGSVGRTEDACLHHQRANLRVPLRCGAQYRA
jgi:hypothetical protein